MIPAKQLRLNSNAPEVPRLAFVHGAYRTGNLIIRDDAIAAVSDWDLQVIGDPMYDVAYVLSDLNREGVAITVMRRRARILS